MQLNEAVSRRLVELMQERGMTQYQLYMKSGVPKSTIGNLVNCAYPSTVLATGQADGVKLLAVCVLKGFPHGEAAPFSLLSHITAHRWAARVRSRDRTGRQAQPPSPLNPEKSRYPPNRCPCRRGTR